MPWTELLAKAVPHSRIYFVLEQRKYKTLTRGMWLRRRVRARQSPESDATAAQAWKADRAYIGSRPLQKLCRPSRAVASERTLHRRLTPPANTVPALRASPRPAADCTRSRRSSLLRPNRSGHHPSPPLTARVRDARRSYVPTVRFMNLLHAVHWRRAASRVLISLVHFKPPKTHDSQRWARRVFVWIRL